MANVRGTMFNHAMRFIRETYGRDAHASVLTQLDEPDRRCFQESVPETAWMPVSAFVAYVEAAKRLLAPDEDGFYRRVGRFSGHLERDHDGYRPMVADPQIAMRLGPVSWRSFYDQGRLEVTILSPTEAVARVYDFAASTALCERRCGAWETLLSNERFTATVTELACRARGAAFCEVHVAWTPREAAEPQQDG